MSRYDEDDDERDREDPDPSDQDVSDEPDLLPCPHCRRMITDETERCPHCGEYLTPGSDPSKRLPAWLVIATILAILAILIFALR